MQDHDERAHYKSRIISVIAATGIALACGTNYAYSAWAPQYAERMKLSATQSNLIGSAGNIGMYASGIPFGILIDTKGPRWAILIGAVSLACGYFPLYSAYQKGAGSMSFSALCFFGFLTGMGSCCAFAGSIKVSATNWPHHRGTATAFPLSGFGLSAFVFTLIGSFAFPNDTGDYLLMLAIGTFCMVFVGSFFMKLMPPASPYQAVPTEDEGRPARIRKNSHDLQSASHSRDGSRSSLPGEPNITGWALAKSPAFWNLFILLGLLCGVGLMTINNIGNNAKTLWHHYDENASHDFIQSRQLMHVAILSIGSFFGRLSSGIGSDFVVKRLHSSRYWSLVASSLIFTLAQVFGLTIENPTHLYLLSSVTGLGYGALFGVFPALVADAFGAAGLGINWGAMTMSPVISGNIFNTAYGAILDSHSGSADGHHRICNDGKACYSQAYTITLVASILGIAWSLWCVRHDTEEKKAQRKMYEDHQP
ncbi:putative MFS transporter [Aureobasidium pullulans EXF-150]|uniref:Putative MFS transporter n=1 Tax=Aureobasidium pullulans EXF-150 TaxID=1043002 RepID=A0A074X718_AURPU|nr:putative MFS transporter [Aureobasidium pullulans EXF-150]KEQ81148.1 putative MFS transporter [Aureobasidium pullulans EXF-150]